MTIWMIPAFALAMLTATPAVSTRSGPLAAPPAGQGQIVFYRPSSIVGRFLGCVIHDRAGTVARLGSGKFVEVSVPPGTYRFSTHGRGAMKLSVDVREGETSYVECSFGGGISVGAADIVVAQESEFVAAAPGLKRSGR